MLRISARHPTYWKAVDLDDFDGTGWRSAATLPLRLESEVSPKPAWHQTLRVTVRDLKSPAYIGAGTALAVRQSPRYAIPSAPGTFTTGREPLRRGDSYLMDVYVPHPTPLEMAKAGSDYPAFATGFLSMALPPRVG